MKRFPAGRTKWQTAAASLMCLGVMVIGMRTISLAGDSSVLRIKLGAKAPNLDLAAPDGKRVKLSDFTGHNVLVDFYRGYW